MTRVTYSCTVCSEANNDEATMLEHMKKFHTEETIVREAGEDKQ